jgi:16S rRNA (adenine1518-N6/adenine1519-N6)-dimethyltransferase
VARVGRILAIEIDPRRAEALRRSFSSEPSVSVVAGDVLEKSFGEWLADAGSPAPAILVANLPYNVATPIVARAIEEPDAISRTVVTVQREVARRFAAVPGDEDYGFLSVRTAAFASARILFDLPPAAFRPRPKVHSSVVELSPRDPPLDPATRRRALEIASLGFRSRRKTLPNALASLSHRETWEEALRGLGKGAKTRAEELSLADFLEIARRVPAARSGSRR